MNDQKNLPSSLVTSPKSTKTEGELQEKLLKMISEGETDPNKLATAIGAKRAVDVYQALDRIARRREFHAALWRSGVDFDYIATKLKDACESESVVAQLKAIGMIMKSTGLDNPVDEEKTGSRPWEEAVIGAYTDKPPQDMVEGPDGMYEVKQPEIPRELAEKKAKEQEVSGGMYREYLKK